MTTLSERVKERMVATGINNAQLAKAAGVEPPTSYNWSSGKTKQIKAGPLLVAAAALGVTPEWLNTGKGQKYPGGKTVPDPIGSKSKSAPPPAIGVDTIARHIAGLAHYLRQMDKESLKDASYALTRLTDNPGQHARAAALFAAAFQTSNKVLGANV